MTPEELFEQLSSEIRRFVIDSEDNAMPGSGRYFDEPLVGVAEGNNPLFHDFRQAVGPFHWLPAEAMECAGIETSGTPLSVISWVLPITRETRESNRAERTFPSRKWALTRDFGEKFNSVLRRHVVAWFSTRGIPAVAPQLTEGWRQVNEGPNGIASTWSERHVAFAAGLGTFSLNDGLITEKGIAHRLGSVVAAIELPATTGINKGRYDNCLYYRFGRCGVCIARCPVNALSRSGHNKQVCMEHVYKTSLKSVGELFGVKNTGCGLCQTAVPCEGINPCR